MDSRFLAGSCETARRAEAWGFDGLLLADSQNLTADIWVELCLAAAATSRLRIGPGVTNPITRHVAVTASAAATLQHESGGRVSLGIGQGDSALSQIGLRPLRVWEFEQALSALQALLRGEEVTLPGDRSSRIRWIDADAAAKVPLHVAATGPKTIAAAARHAEGVDLTRRRRFRPGRSWRRDRPRGGTGADPGRCLPECGHRLRSVTRA